MRYNRQDGVEIKEWTADSLQRKAAPAPEEEEGEETTERTRGVQGRRAPRAAILILKDSQGPPVDGAWYRANGNRAISSLLGRCQTAATTISMVARGYSVYTSQAELDMTSTNLENIISATCRDRKCAPSLQCWIYGEYSATKPSQPPSATLRGRTASSFARRLPDAERIGDRAVTPL